jgi:2-oxoglutarate ferredoxin oxidoreductase subunit beta
MNIPVKPISSVPLTKADFVSKQTVRWCPGCGDYSILANVQKLMPELNIPRENIVFVSGIGCSSRFPYYMNTYGMHTIHGRAPAFATGLKVARPELSVWIVTGDGDGLSIGGNQLLHMLRRNLDVNVLLFNNRIYGLTKGQYSPTSEQGKVTKSTPFGSPDMPLNPMLFALSAGATFIARTFDVDAKGMRETIKAAANHKGTSFVEIYQNCNIFNDGTFSAINDRSAREDRILRLKHGEVLVFGKDKNKGIRMRGLKPIIVDLDKDYNEKELLRHDQYCEDSTLANLLSGFDFPEFPVPMGVLRQVENSTYGEIIEQQIKTQIEKKGVGNFAELLRGNQVWTY